MIGDRAWRPLQGLRVVETSPAVAVRYCGGMFAALGAGVTTTIEAPTDDDIGYGGPAGRAYGRWLDMGKSRTPLGDDDPLSTADLVITGPGQPEAAGGGDPRRAQGDGGPVTLSIGWFDPRGPYGSWRATDEIISSLTGVAYSFGEPDGPPTLPQGHGPQIIAAVNAFNAGLAALLDAPPRRPERVDVNVLESAMCVSEVAAIAALDDERSRSVRMGVNRFVPTYPAASYRTADGWLGVTCLTPAQWHALCEMIDRPDLAGEHRYSTAFRRLLRADEVDAALVPAFLERSTAAWVDEGDARRIPVTPMLSPAQLPHHEHWRARASFAPVDGLDVVAPTLPFRAQPDGVTASRRPSDATGPLSGVRIVDLSMGWSGPQATRALADLGADVIKVESADHPDWYRGWEADQGGDPPPTETRSSFNTLNRNKRGVALDLGSPDGADAARSLIAGADMVIENFASGVLDRLGFGHAALQQLRPGLISLSMPAFGSGGPLTGLRAYGSTVEQASGLPFVNGRAEWAPCLQHVAYGDPVAGLYAAAVLLAALAGRERCGGATLELAQVECLFQVGADAIIAEQVAGAPLPRTGSRRPRLSPCCVVPTREEDGWLSVAVDSDDAWRGLLTALRADGEKLPALAGADGATLADRKVAEDDIEAAIASWARHRDADDAASTLQGHGVAAAPVRPAHALGRDPQLVACGFWETMDRHYVGRHMLGAPAWRFDDRRPEARSPAPTLGEHTAEVLEGSGTGWTTGAT